MEPLLTDSSLPEGDDTEASASCTVGAQGVNVAACLYNAHVAMGRLCMLASTCAVCPQHRSDEAVKAEVAALMQTVLRGTAQFAAANGVSIERCVRERQSALRAELPTTAVDESSPPPHAAASGSGRSSPRGRLCHVPSFQLDPVQQEAAYNVRAVDSGDTESDSLRRIDLPSALAHRQRRLSTDSGIGEFASPKGLNPAGANARRVSCGASETSAKPITSHLYAATASSPSDSLNVLPSATILGADSSGRGSVVDHSNAAVSAEADLSAPPPDLVATVSQHQCATPIHSTPTTSAVESARLLEIPSPGSTLRAEASRIVIAVTEAIQAERNASNNAQASGSLLRHRQVLYGLELLRSVAQAKKQPTAPRYTGK